MGFPMIAKPDALIKLETYFTLRDEDADPIGDLEWRYAKFIAGMDTDPAHGWEWTAHDAGLDLGQLNDPEGKWVNLTALLPFLLHACKQAVKGPFPMHFKLVPLTGTGDPDWAKVESDIVDGECIVTIGVSINTGGETVV